LPQLKETSFATLTTDINPVLLLLKNFFSIKKERKKETKTENFFSDFFEQEEREDK
jgi:hypothetical protein